ncbi:MAG: alpha/beta hydrolase [Desulfomonilia bacterium]
MSTSKEPVTFFSRSEQIAGMLFHPCPPQCSPALVLCHGALDFKENYFELACHLAEHGIAALVLDMHGNGESQGLRYHVNIGLWVEDIRSALDFLEGHPLIDAKKIGAFGLSSGGTAILEAALVEPRLKTLITLDATVRNPLTWTDSVIMRLFVWLGHLKRFLTGDDLHLEMNWAFSKTEVASDPDVNRMWRENPRVRAMWSSFPLPGAAQSVFVDTITRVGSIRIPTLVLHGAEDRIDSPETARMLYHALNCVKDLCIIEGNGHIGHLDRNKKTVMELTTQWALNHLNQDPHRESPSEPHTTRPHPE